MKTKIALLLAIAIVALAALMGSAKPADAGVHCYFGGNLWDGQWYCFSW